MIRIGLVTNEEEYESMCTDCVSLFNEEEVRIHKTPNFCIIISSILIIRIFKYEGEITISEIIRSGRHTSILISDKLKIPHNHFSWLYQLCNLGPVGYRNFNKVEK